MVRSSEMQGHLYKKHFSLTTHYPPICKSISIRDLFPHFTLPSEMQGHLYKKPSSSLHTTLLPQFPCPSLDPVTLFDSHTCSMVSHLENIHISNLNIFFDAEDPWCRCGTDSTIEDCQGGSVQERSEGKCPAREMVRHHIDETIMSIWCIRTWNSACRFAGSIGGVNYSTFATP